jgi:hypothetical protein
MAYRDEEVAARERVEALERELAVEKGKHERATERLRQVHKGEWLKLRTLIIKKFFGLLIFCVAFFSLVSVINNIDAADMQKALNECRLRKPAKCEILKTIEAIKAAEYVAKHARALMEKAIADRCKGQTAHIKRCVYECTTTKWQ